MKKIITEQAKSEVLADDLIGREIVAYRCPNSESVCLLTRVSRGSRTGFGFVNIANTITEPTYFGENFFESIKSANANRKLFVFEDQTEFIKSIQNKTF